MGVGQGARDRDEVLTHIGPGWGGSSNPSPASLALAAALAQAYLAPEDCWVRPLFAIHHPQTKRFHLMPHEEGHVTVQT